MTTRTQTKLEAEISDNHASLEQARAEVASLKAELDAVPERLREARAEGRRVASEAHQQRVAARRSGSESKRNRAGLDSERAEAVELAESKVRRAENSAKVLRQDYREARAHVADLEARAWQMERSRALQEIESSGIGERETKARQAIEEAQENLEAVEGERRLLEGRASQANRQRHQAERMARAIRSGEADSDGFDGVR